MNDTQKAIIKKTVSFVKKELADAEAGHDWWHIYRVWKLSRHIGKKENVDMFTVELGALLHDIADWKFYNGDESVGPKKARDFLASLDVEEQVITHIENILKHISFKGEDHVQTFTSKELDVVQDADRLDAIGAIGIGRTFTYGGHTGRAMYDPNSKPKRHMKKEEYHNRHSPTINHFYEKLLLLKDRMNTKEGKSMAEHRHEYMKEFLDEFYKEWEGEL